MTQFGFVGVMNDQRLSFQTLTVFSGSERARRCYAPIGKHHMLVPLPLPARSQVLAPFYMQEIGASTPGLSEDAGG